MSTLVAELLELARLDRTSSLDLAETDLASVVRDAVADAVAVEPERPVRAEAPPRLVAVVDEPRIRQVLANLLGNVRAHTPVTTPVAVRLGQITGGVLIEVADAGPGMANEDAIRAFDRFHRATDRPAAARSYPRLDEADADHDAAGSDPNTAATDRNAAGTDPNTAATDRNAAGAEPNTAPALNGAAGPGPGQHRRGARPVGAVTVGVVGNGTASMAAADSGAIREAAMTRAERTSGSGLGLSIVQAIANAHGGRATLESWLGHGTKVRVWLPVRIVP